MFNEMWKQKSFLLVLALVLLVCCSIFVVEIHSLNSEDVETMFMQYVEQFNKSYRFNSNEYQNRFQKFQKSLAIINSMNTLRTHKDSAIYGLTDYSDMSHDEFISMNLNENQSSQILNRRNSIVKNRDEIGNWKRHHVPYNIIRYQRDVSASTYTLPERIDWRERGVISEIRNQGACGACWAFSVIGTIESMIAIEVNSSSVIQLSVQQMIDCSDNNNGCHGGDSCNLLAWLLDEKVKIQTNEEYPINLEDNQCKMTTTKSMSTTVQIKSYACDNFVGQEDEILFILAKYGPVVVAVNGLLWQNYLGGIIQFHCDGSIDSLNHAVQIVGYDKTGDVPYYIARNSWGRQFGDRGYLKIQIGGNVCGVANQVSTVNVELKHETKTIQTLS